MGDSSRTTTLVFDVLGTLLDEDAGQRAAVAETLGPGADALTFWGAWQEAFHALVVEVREQRRPYAPAEALSAEAIAAVGDGLGVDLAEGQVRRLVTSGRRLDPFPEVAGALGQLGETFALVALTNAGTAQAFEMSRHAGLRWSTLISGETVGAYKPDARMYEHAVRSLDLRPPECVFVAAHPWDLDAAARHGFRTAYVDRAGSTPAQMASFAERFDQVASDLVALAGQLTTTERWRP